MHACRHTHTDTHTCTHADTHTHTYTHQPSTFHQQLKLKIECSLYGMFLKTYSHAFSFIKGTNVQSHLMVFTWKHGMFTLGNILCHLSPYHEQKGIVTSCSLAACLNLGLHSNKKECLSISHLGIQETYS